MDINMEIVVFLCENSIEGILTGVYDAWAEALSSGLGHARCRLQTELLQPELFCTYRETAPDMEKAGKVIRTLRKRLGEEVYECLCYAMASREPDKAEAERREDCALNDIAITRRGSLQIISFHIYVNGQLLHVCHADGILVATPTGSTGYNLSAGGPIVEPHAQLILLTPICPHTMSSRPIVLSAEDEVVIEIGENKKGIVQEVEACFDGSVKMAMFAGDRMEIRRAGKVTEMLKLSQDSFVEVLHKKMDA